MEYVVLHHYWVTTIDELTNRSGLFVTLFHLFNEIVTESEGTKWDTDF